MTNIIPFEFESNKIRTVVDKDNIIWFVAKDIAEALGYKWQPNLLDKVPEEWKGIKPFNTLGGKQKTAIISEQGLYFFCVRSDKPKALPLQKWIAGDVLPTLRKTGSYSLKPKKLVSPSSYIKVHQFIEQTLTKAGLKENQLLLATNRGVAKLTGFDLLSSSDIKHLPSPDNDEYIIPTEIGEMLNPVIKAKALNSWLTELGLQIPKHTGKGYLPTPQGEERGGKMCDVPLQHVEGSTQHLHWNPKILVPYLQDLINNNPTL